MNKNMPLQSDITVLYALQEKRVAVTNKDLQVDSKYNTYKNTGLPVGPGLLAVCGHTWMTFSTTRREIIITSSPEGWDRDLFQDAGRAREGCFGEQMVLI